MPECRFEVWPYLERFAEDATKAVKAELHKAGHGENPDFIIGNYSDGNLVASLMSHALGVTQCNIAHALEKTKYNDADINWCVISYLLHVTRFATQYMVVLDQVMSPGHCTVPWICCEHHADFFMILHATCASSSNAHSISSVSYTGQ